MKLSVEISMYPLQEDYKAKIKEFLVDINAVADESANSSIEIRTTNMSTRIFGEFDSVTQLLNYAMQRSMQLHGKIVFVCKYLEGDARELEGWD